MFIVLFVHDSPRLLAADRAVRARNSGARAADGRSNIPGLSRDHPSTTRSATALTDRQADEVVRHHSVPLKVGADVSARADRCCYADFRTGSG
jgi:hypothetical protein